MQLSLRNSITVLALFILSIRFFSLAVILSLIWVGQQLAAWLLGVFKHHKARTLEQRWRHY